MVPHRISFANWFGNSSRLILLAVGPLCACGYSGVPRESPFITGVVVWRNASRFGVEAPTGALRVPQSGEDRAEVELTRGTRILRRSGGEAAREDLAPGCTVSVWTTGVIRDSYPVQVEATVVVLEPGCR